MDTVYFENEELPVYSRTESLSEGTAHSQIAHYHDHLEIIVVSGGSLICQTGMESFDLHSGDVCLINRRQLHQIHEEGGPGCCQKVLVIGTSLLSQNPLVYDRYIRPMLDDAGFSHVRFEGSGSPAHVISEIVTRIGTLQEEKGPGYELELIAAVYRLGRQLYLAYSEEPGERPVDGNALIQQRMAEYIYGHFSEPVSLNDIAGAGNVSRSQCAKLFHDYTGLSPITFLNRHRLEVSCDLLRRTRDSMAAVAQQCGFADQSYFNRMFIREYGVTPRQYRKSGVTA